jgi:hypothetical protein
MKKYQIMKSSVFNSYTWVNVKKKMAVDNYKKNETYLEMEEYMTHLYYITSGDGVDKEDIEFIFTKVGLDLSLCDLFVGIGSIMKENFQEATVLFNYRKLDTIEKNMRTALIGLAINRWELDHMLAIVKSSLEVTKIFPESSTDAMAKLKAGFCLEFIIDLYKALEGMMPPLARCVDHMVYKN